MLWEQRDLNRCARCIKLFSELEKKQNLKGSPYLCHRCMIKVIILVLSLVGLFILAARVF